MNRYKKTAQYLDKWMEFREKGSSVNTWFEIRKLHKIAIYGYGIIGRHLIWELEQSTDNINIVWILDRRADNIDVGKYPVYHPELLGTIELPELIVVCAIHDFDEIEALISSQVRVPVVSFETIFLESERRMIMEINT